MRAFLEIILSLLAVMGLMSIGWLTFGHMLSPVGGRWACVVIPAHGNGENLEQAVTGMLWLRGGGLMEAPILMVDCGLNAEGKAVAAALCLREPEIGLCPLGELAEHVRSSP